MNVIARLDRSRGKADDLPIAAHHFTRRNRRNGEFVPAGNGLLNDDVSRAVGQARIGLQTRFGNDDVIQLDASE